jgi:DNA-binding GntR family transcriptional regulator
MTSDDGGAVRVASDAIRDAILRREFPPGLQLRQAELASQLNLSRVPVREALNVLESEGLLVHKPHSGYYVRRLSQDELHQIYLMEDLLEGAVLSRVSRPPAATIDSLKAMNTKLEQAIRRRDVHGMVVANREFHMAVLALGNLPVVLKEIARLWRMSESYRVLHFSDYLGQTTTMDQHRQMISAIADGDGKLLAKLAKAHRREGETSVTGMLNR